MNSDNNSSKQYVTKSNNLSIIYIIIMSYVLSYIELLFHSKQFKHRDT